MSEEGTSYYMKHMNHELFAEFGVASKISLLRDKYTKVVDNAESSQESSEFRKEGSDHSTTTLTTLCADTRVRRLG